MTQVVSTSVVDDAGAARLRAPRDDLVEEHDEGGGNYSLATGPFRAYHRRLDLTPRPDGRWDATETTDFHLAIPGWGVLFVWPVKRSLRQRAEGHPWWSPPCRLDARAARILGLLCTASLISGYLGTLITQTITFSATEFHVGSGSQGTTLAAVRVGVLLSLFLAVLADRRGRRRLLLACAVGGILTAAVGALSPDLVLLGVTQTLSRAFTTALSLLIVVVAAEEMPRSARAYAVGVMAMTAGLGAGMCVWLLPLAGLGVRAWRLLYVAPLLALPLVRALARGLPESRRFVAHRRRDPIAGHRGRLGLLAGTAFLGAMFLAPASQFQNDFLRHQHHFSATGLTLFTLVTNTPAGIGIVVGGRLADARGRRLIGAFGVAAGTILTVVSFQVGGPMLWITALVGTTVAATTIPALGVYGPELFPTTLRGLTNGIITLVGVVGSAVGLVIAGQLNEHYGRYGPGIALLGLGPLLMAVLILAFYPETAHRELEELNPEDGALSALAVALPTEGL